MGGGGQQRYHEGVGRTGCRRNRASKREHFSLQWWRFSWGACSGRGDPVHG
jgi:hypothetical protein